MPTKETTRKVNYEAAKRGHSGANDNSVKDKIEDKGKEEIGMAFGLPPFLTRFILRHKILTFFLVVVVPILTLTFFVVFVTSVL